LRVKAAFELGTLNGFKSLQQISLLLKINVASKLAIRRYARYAPQLSPAANEFDNEFD